MSNRTLYQDVSAAELARERRHEKRAERAAKVARSRRIADLRAAEEMAMETEMLAVEAWCMLVYGSPEIQAQRNEILEELPWVEADDTKAYNPQTSLPIGQWRKLDV